jgi:hypothetical protein
MANVRNLRREASSLFAATKRAFKFIRDNPSGAPEEREAVLQALREVIDRTDPPDFDESLCAINLVMTNPTADAIMEILKGSAAESEEARATYEAMTEGMRRTKQRVYVRLNLDHVTLRHLHYVLRHKPPRAQEAAFERLANSVAIGLQKNPMEILGQMGL